MKGGVYRMLTYKIEYMELNESEDRNINAICIELNEYLMGRFRYKVLPAYRTFSGGTNIMTRRRIKFDIYLRFYYSQTPRWPANTIVIARLGFQKTRKGNGTHFISFLKGIALKYDFEYISLECTNENSSAFAKHFNFKESKYGNEDYIIAIKDLKL
ncbi:hypothetical protein INE94_00967 [Parabacteroides distasonis]|nr:hypothetical protein INE94_00967 [Parabacteroides distasonis]